MATLIIVFIIAITFGIKSYSSFANNGGGFSDVFNHFFIPFFWSFVIISGFAGLVGWLN